VNEVKKYQARISHNIVRKHTRHSYKWLTLENIRLFILLNQASDNTSTF